MSEVKCTSCGSPNVEKVGDNLYQCPYCGEKFSNTQVMAPSSSMYYSQQVNPTTQSLIEEDMPNKTIMVVSFFFPLVGIILYFTKKNKQPLCAKSYGKWACYGFAFSFLLNFIIELIARCS